MSFLEVRKAAEPSLLATKGIVGVGGTTDKIKVYVEGSPYVPSQIGGYRTEIIKAGHITALSLMQLPFFKPAKPLTLERTQRVRPVLGGYSIGNVNVTAGTLAVALSLGTKLYGLSNNHVLASADTIQNKRASIGDHILQPGVYDGGRDPDDLVGTLHSWIRLDEVGTNIVDCAIFEPTSPDVLSTEILGIGNIVGFTEAKEEMLVQKSGRTTGLNSASVRDTQATMKVDYGLFTATFEQQIVTDYLADGGDSGSLLCDTVGPNAVGLLFAGSSYVTVHNKIGNVLSALALPPVAVGPALPYTLLGSLFSGLVLLGLSTTYHGGI